MAHVTYDPLDLPKRVADNVFVVDSGPMRIVGAPIPVRMSVLRLPDGQLLLHSPTRWSEPLAAALAELGPVGHLVAPNTVHWSFIAQWQKRFPQATCWAVPGLGARPAVARSGLRIDKTLADGVVPEWGEAVECILVQGLGICEAGLFHRPSRSLVLTDLVVNVEPQKLPMPLSIGARLVGSAAPHGRAPIYFRMAMRMGGENARAAARRLLALNPERVVFAHGAWFDTDAGKQLQAALSWLAQ